MSQAKIKSMILMVENLRLQILKVRDSVVRSEFSRTLEAASVIVQRKKKPNPDTKKILPQESELHRAL